MTRVLVVDDRQDNRYLLRVLLEAHGFEFDEAANGAEALAKARLDPPALLISDLLMPVMDGFTLLREWKADEWLAGIPFVVYTSSYTERSDEALALDLGADAFILKPADQARFVAELRRLATAARSGGLEPPRGPRLSEAQALEGHNQVLLRKLQEKLGLLEKEVIERERTLAQLRSSEARFKSLVDHSMDMILMGAPDGSISSANAAACEAFGMSEAQICAAGRDRIVDPGDTRLAAFVAERAATGRATGELTMLRADGTPFPVELTSAAYTDADGAERVSLVMRDISARKRAQAQRRELERQLRDAQKLQAVGALAAGIAHDFNNVVGAILGFAALARAELLPDAPAQQHLGQIQASGERARALVQRILSFSRPQPLMLVNLPLQPLVEETLRMLRASFPSLVGLKTSVPKTPLHACVDATQLQQVLLNLCTNACHAIEGRPGGIEVGLDGIEFLPTQHDRPGELPPGRYLHLWVSDEGCGMDALTMSRIFEPFFTTRAPGQGSGLGLAAARSIVIGLGGVVSVESEVDRGSCFHVYLPQVEPDAGSGTAPSESDRAIAPAGSARVLAVDDDLTLTLLAEALLGRAGHEVTAFTDPFEALAALRAQPEGFDLLLSDFNMPHKTGLSLAAEVAALCPGLPVVLVSGYIDERLRADAAAAGVRALVNKERIAEDLVRVVQRVLRTGRD